MMHTRNQAPDTSTDAARAADSRQFVTFLLGEQQYCVDIMAVREIRASNVVTPLPSAPDYVRGVTNLRGTIVPIIDLRTRFGLGRTEVSQGVVVVVMIGGRLNGLLVDGVSDILTVRQADISPIPDTDGENRNPFFEGLVTQNDTMLIIVALDRLTKSQGPANIPASDDVSPLVA
jgi:purine-binding chemotaxis protein CheW